MSLCTCCYITVHIPDCLHVHCMNTCTLVIEIGTNSFMWEEYDVCFVTFCERGMFFEHVDVEGFDGKLWLKTVVTGYEKKRLYMYMYLY